MNLLSDSEKNVFQAAIRDVHDTFKRSVTIFKTPEKVIVSTNPNYNFAYTDNQINNDTVSYVVNSGVFDARIHSLSTQQANELLFVTSKNVSDTTDESKLSQVKNIITIKLDKAGYDFIFGAKFVEVDEDKYIILSSARKHGLFTPEYYTYYLQRTN